VKLNRGLPYLRASRDEPALTASVRCTETDSLYFDDYRLNDRPELTSTVSGFGGTNAHAIIEQYEPETAVARVAPAFLPFPISAASENSLLEQARRMSSWLRENPNVSLPDLSWTLNSRRSAFPFRWHFSASTTEQLAEKLDNKLQADYESVSLISSSTPRILGIFTGQGAQYAAMAASLVERSRFAEAIVDKLEASLSALPDAPTWSLKAELLAVASQSRISEAALSQPLCTAVQILLVDMLREAGIRFTAVVGHSSGEIGAAYAAGLLRPEDAIRIAYYRGVHSKLARGRDGQMGAMLAVGTSLDDAREFCAFEDLQGRITVAACNSPSSVTLSGDADAIEEAKEVLDDEGKFVRMLRVDTAYHSHHMLPCSEPYLESLRRCAIKIQDASANPDRPAWFSSVCEQEMTADVAGLDGEYWKDNMVNTVMFSQALEKAISTQGPFDFAFEIGPHPALQGPALQTINEATGSRIPYTGVLSRGVDAIEAFAEALGYAWRHLNDTSIINLRGYDRALSGDQPLNLLKGLPSYAFDHERIYWRESRLVKATRTRTTPYHQLLGIPCPDGTHPTLMRWKNLLNPKEIPWLDGHVVQGRPVFPGTGYMSMAIDACRALAASLDRKIQFLEIEDFVIGKAIVFDERSIGVETMLTLSLDRALDARAETFSGSVCMYAALANSDVTSLPSRFTCRVQVGLASPGQDVLVEEALLPPRTQPITNFVEVEPERFYSHLARVGYEYSGLFQGLTGMKRTLDEATALVHNPSLGDPIRSPTLHPAMLDCVIQSVILAFCYPGDGKLYTLHVPTKIKRILINLPLLEEETRGECLLPVDSVVNATSIVSGDAHLFATDGVSTLLQLQGIEVAPLTPPTADNDAQLFFTYALGVAVPDGELMMNGQRATEGDYEFSVVAERIGYYFLKNLLAVLTPEDIEKSEWHHKRLVNFARKVLADLQSGTDPFTDPAWYHDTKDMIYDMMERYKHKVEITLARRVGENLPAAVRGETVILEHMVADNVLNDLYSQGLGFVEYSRFLAEGVAQLVHRYPHMNILEIGAGTGGATKVIVPKLGKAFSSYTFTDISGGFFPTAQQVFRDYSDCMMFKVLDVEKDVLEQGFKEGAYDVVVASLVLHATRDLDATVRNVRRLLKPGGYLYMLELTNLRPIRTSFTMSGLQGWWMGSAKDGREFTPCVDANQWNTILQNNGFSSIDAITPDLDPEPWPSNIIVAQAVDDRVMALRRPLSAPVPERKGPELIILGGNKLQTSLLAEEVERLVSGWFTTVRRVLTLEDLAYMDLEPRTTVLSLTDLDSPIFRGMTADRLEGLKRVSGEARNVLWLLRDARAGDPHLSMTVGFGYVLQTIIPPFSRIVALLTPMFDVQSHRNGGNAPAPPPVSRL
jgi:hybrid polyketide synthase/nonribosomal peptide synthetase ACE1